MDNIMTLGDMPPILFVPAILPPEVKVLDRILVVQTLDLYLKVRDLVRDDSTVRTILHNEIIPEQNLLDAIENPDKVQEEKLPEAQKMEFDVKKWYEEGKGADH
jgi:hypothetical protein